eukprot:1480688-Rhodomonas_salina.1
MVLSSGPPGLLPPGHARSVGPGVRTPVCPDHGPSGHGSRITDHSSSLCICRAAGKQHGISASVTASPAHAFSGLLLLTLLSLAHTPSLLPQGHSCQLSSSRGAGLTFMSSSSKCHFSISTSTWSMLRSSTITLSSGSTGRLEVSSSPPGTGGHEMTVLHGSGHEVTVLHGSGHRMTAG